MLSQPVPVPFRVRKSRMRGGLSCWAPEKSVDDEIRCDPASKQKEPGQCIKGRSTLPFDNQIVPGPKCQTAQKRNYFFPAWIIIFHVYPQNVGYFIRNLDYPIPRAISGMVPGKTGCFPEWAGYHGKKTWFCRKRTYLSRQGKPSHPENF